MQVQGKIWGSTSTLFSNNNVEVHRIIGNVGGYCSVHRHNNKYNMFFVECGKLKIRTWKTDYDLIDETIIVPGQHCIIAPGQYHQFEVLESTVAYEIYWTEIDAEDIDRKSCGGARQAA